MREPDTGGLEKPDLFVEYFFLKIRDRGYNMVETSMKKLYDQEGYL